MKLQLFALCVISLICVSIADDIDVEVYEYDENCIMGEPKDCSKAGKLKSSSSDHN